MDLRTFKKLALVSAVAFGAVLYADSARSAPILSGTATSVPITATVNNTITVNTTPLSFGTVAAIGKAATNAVATVAPGATTLTDAPGLSTVARILKDTGNTPTTASVTIGAFNNTLIHIDYSGITDMSNGGAQVLEIVHLKDNLNTPDTGVGGTAGNWNDAAGYAPGPATNQGTATTTGAGALVFHIGGSFATASANYVYTNGTYNGDFDVTVSY